jgi:hypothetical protein
MSERTRQAEGARHPRRRSEGTARWVRPADGKGGGLRVHKRRPWSWDRRVRRGQIVLAPDAVGGSRCDVHGSDGNSRAPAG